MEIEHATTSELIQELANRCHCLLVSAQPKHIEPGAPGMVMVIAYCDCSPLVKPAVVGMAQLLLQEAIDKVRRGMDPARFDYFPGG